MPRSACELRAMSSAGTPETFLRQRGDPSMKKLLAMMRAREALFEPHAATTIALPAMLMMTAVLATRRIETVDAAMTTVPAVMTENITETAAMTETTIETAVMIIDIETARLLLTALDVSDATTVIALETAARTGTGIEDGDPAAALATEGIGEYHDVVFR